MSWRNPPIDFDPRLIVDPQRPIPKSMGRKKAKMIQELREAYQWNLRQVPARKTMKMPEDIAAYLIPFVAGLRVEHLILLCFNVRRHLIADPVMISMGDIDSTDVAARAVFRVALEVDANSIIIAHNHPSGDATPSSADKAVTRQIVAAGKILNVPCDDHFIIGAGGAWSCLRRNDPGLFI